MLTELGAPSATGANNPRPARLPIVGIGASAGGIEAFRGFFENMPPDSGMGFVVILHLPPDRKSLLSDDDAGRPAQTGLTSDGFDLRRA